MCIVARYFSQGLVFYGQLTQYNVLFVEILPMFRSFLLAIVCAMSYSVTHAAEYGPVGPTDTLESIANVYSGASDYNTSQWMVALWQANPDAFQHYNIYGLKSQSMLTLPSDEQLRTVTVEQAEEFLATHAMLK